MKKACYRNSRPFSLATSTAPLSFFEDGSFVPPGYPGFTFSVTRIFNCLKCIVDCEIMQAGFLLLRGLSGYYLVCNLLGGGGNPNIILIAIYIGKSGLHIICAWSYVLIDDTRL